MAGDRNDIAVIGIRLLAAIYFFATPGCQLSLIGPMELGYFAVLMNFTVIVYGAKIWYIHFGLPKLP